MSEPFSGAGKYNPERTYRWLALYWRPDDCSCADFDARLAESPPSRRPDDGHTEAA